MNPVLRFREEMQRVPFLVDELESISGQISGSWSVEHKDDGTHSAIHADSIDVGSGRTLISDDGLEIAGSTTFTFATDMPPLNGYRFRIGQGDLGVVGYTPATGNVRQVQVLSRWNGVGDSDTEVVLYAFHNPTGGTARTASISCVAQNSGSVISMSAQSIALGGSGTDAVTIPGTLAITGLFSPTNIVLGTGNDVVRLSGDDATYRLWVGNATAGSAKFRVTKGGVATLDGAALTGAGSINISGSCAVGSFSCNDLAATTIIGTSTLSITGTCALATAGGASTIGGKLEYGTVAAGNNFHALDTGVFTSGKTGTGANTHFQNYNANGQIGSITSSGSATAYNTSSDGDLKKNIVISGRGLADIAAIEIVDFEFKTEPGIKRIGVIAQQLFNVFPDAVTAPTEVDVPWMVDYSKLVPLALRAIQQLNARLTAIGG